MYSDDFGASWNILGVRTDIPFTAKNANEPKCEELPDGTVILESRCSGKRLFNFFIFSDDTKTTGTWQTASYFTTGDNKQGTNGEIHIIKAKKANDDTEYTVALVSAPNRNGRNDVTIWWKDITETSSYQTGGVDDPSVFASGWGGLEGANTNMYKVSSIGSAYSTMTTQSDGRIGFYYEEEPGGYEMVYVPLNIATITNNTYESIVLDLKERYTALIATAKTTLGNVTAANVGKIGYAPTALQYQTLTNAIATADAKVAVTGWTVTQEEYNTLYDAYDAVQNNAEITLPTAGTIVTVQNKDAVTGGVAANAYLWVNTASNKMQMRGTTDKTTYFLVGNDTDGNITLKSLASSLYVSGENESTVQKATTTSAPITLTASADNGYVYMQAGTAESNYMTLSGTGWQPILGSTATTKWYITDVTSEYIDLKKTEVQGLLDLGGKVGYPKTTSKGYTVLSDTLATFKNLGQTEQVAFLDSLNSKISKYKAETDLTMPEAGKVYTLKSYIKTVSGTGSQYHYLTSNVIGVASNGSATEPTVDSQTTQTHYWKAASSDESSFTLSSNAGESLVFQFHDNTSSFSLIPGTEFGYVSLVKSSGKGYRICMSSAGVMSSTYKITTGNTQSKDWSSDWIIEEATGYIYEGTAMSDAGSVTGTFAHTKNDVTVSTTLGGFVVLDAACEDAETEFSVTPTTTPSGDKHFNVSDGIASNYKTLTWAYGELATTTNSAETLASANEKMAFAGKLGYPKTTSAGYVALKKAYDQIEAGSNTSVTTGYLTILYNNYIAETNVVTPVAGKVYSFRTDLMSPTTDNPNRYLVDANGKYLTNPVNGQINGLETQALASSGHLQTGGYWKCVAITNSGAAFTSSLGNVMGERVIASSMNKAQYYTFGRGTEWGKMYIKFGTNGKYMAAWNDGTKVVSTTKATSLDVSTVQSKNTNNSTDWLIEEVDNVNQFVYDVTVSSDKPSTYADIAKKVEVTMTGTVTNDDNSTTDFTEKTSGVGFFVVDAKVIAANPTCTANDFSTDFFDKNATVESTRPTATFNKTDKQVNVNYSFDYATAMVNKYNTAYTELMTTGFGWPKTTMTGGVYDVVAKKNFNTVLLTTFKTNYPNMTMDTDGTTAKTWTLYTGDDASKNAAAYNLLATALSEYESNIGDDDILLPENGSPVLLTQVFSNPNGETYNSYAYNTSLTLKLAMVATTKSNIGSTMTTLPDNPTTNYMWAVQRDDEKTVTKITTTEKGRVDYTGDDKYTKTQLSSVSITAEDFTTATSGQTVTDTETDPIVTVTEKTVNLSYQYDATPAAADISTTQGSTTYSGGTENETESHVDLNGTYLESRTYDQTSYLRQGTKVAKRLYYASETEGVITGSTTATYWTDENHTELASSATDYPAYLWYTSDATPVLAKAEADGYTAAYADYETPTYNAHTKIVNHVVEKYQTVSVAREYPSYYISAVNGEGYIGRASASSFEAIMTDKHDLQFNVVFVRGTKLGTVGMLYLVNEATPRYIATSLAGNKFDRYKNQVAYDTEQATSISGVWSTDWGFVQAKHINTHAVDEKVTVTDNGTTYYVKRDGTLTTTESEGVTTGEYATTWTSPIGEGHQISFVKSVEQPGITEPDKYCYSTLNLPYAVSLPTDATKGVYIVTGAKRLYNEGTAVASRTTLVLDDIMPYLQVTVSGESQIILPRETPVIIYHASDTKYYLGATVSHASVATAAQISGLNAALEKNLLKGTLGATAVPSDEYPYVLSAKSSTNLQDGNAYKTVAFYHYSGTKFGANKAYIDWNDVTVDESQSARKNHSLYTIDQDDWGEETGIEDVISKNNDINGDIYNLNGQRINTMQHGVNIVNGKKIIK